jgi:hypothetical protein
MSVGILGSDIETVRDVARFWPGFIARAAVKMLRESQSQELSNFHRARGLVR